MHAGDLAGVDLSHHRPLPHQDELRLAAAAAEVRPGVQQDGKVLLGRHAPDVGHQQVVRPDAEELAVSRAPVPGVEHLGIDPAGPESGVLDAAAPQVLFVDARRTEDPAGLAVEPLEVGPPHPPRPLDPVAGGVLLIVGMGAGDEGDAELARGLEPREPHRPLGGYVAHVGSESLQVAQQLPLMWEGPLHIGIEEERDTGRLVHLGRDRRAVGGAVGRGIDPHFVPAGLEGPGEVPEGDPDAAHHRPVHL